MRSGTLWTLSGGRLALGVLSLVSEMRVLCAVLVLASVLPVRAPAYSVLTHEAIIDTLWDSAIRPVLLAKFPAATSDQLLEAHAYAYGGCIIQDLGYYPFGSHFFSDLTHYVRSADFIDALIADAQTLDEYAFALGAAAHYGADVDGHSIAVNLSVPELYPRLRAKYGDVVTYADNPAAHLKTEFGLDVLQVARGHYAPQSYHDFIGFRVSKELLERAFQETYGLKLKDVFGGKLDLALGTYRFSVRTVIPETTRVAWELKKEEISKQQPGMTRAKFIYNMDVASYRREWDSNYHAPGFMTRVLAMFLRILPKVGIFRGLGYKLPTPHTEELFQKSFDAAVKEDRQMFAEIEAGNPRIRNRDLDTGKPVSPGEYHLTDLTYDRLLKQLAKQHYAGVEPELRANILAFYAAMKTPDPHGTRKPLAALDALRESD